MTWVVRVNLLVTKTLKHQVQQSDELIYDVMVAGKLEYFRPHQVNQSGELLHTGGLGVVAKK